MQNLKIAQLILAAGTSSRMGRPKQLLPWGNITLIEHAIKQSIKTKKVATYVVLGAYFDAIFDQINHLPIEIIKNQKWQMGMGKSIQIGLQAILNEEHQYDAVLISLIDQPLITSQHYLDLIHKFETNVNQIVASDLGGRVGVPAIFSKEIFEELLQLDTDYGARYIIEKYSDQTTTISLNTFGKDVDTIEQYEQIIRDGIVKQSK